MFGTNSAKSDNCLVIGNGESRKNLYLENFQNNYTLIGCNAICRDISVDHLVVCDKRMIEEVVNHPHNINSKIYVRDDWFHYYRKIKKNKNVICLPDIPYSPKYKQDEKRNWGSGTYAVLLAAQMNFKNVFLVGFDLYSINNRVNNIYKDTSNYSPSHQQPVDPSYWIYQIAQTFSLYPDIQFTVINQQEWKLPIDWQRLNVRFKSINEFLLDNKYSSSIITT